ncbi:MAG: glycosyltransferase [Gammaproteobacteria bacterium]|nr:glycosyltransferase [Gammaproteobacteria bacterium]
MRKRLEEWTKQGIVEHWGYSTNVAETMAKSHIAMRPSLSKGLPKPLIRAAACGRTVITTDLLGCTDTISPYVTGLLLPANTAVVLAERAFTIENVIQSHLMIYGGMRNTE